MAIRKHRNMHIFFGLAVCISIITAIAVSDNGTSGFLWAAMLEFLAFCFVITWIIEVLINHRADKLRSRQLSGEELRRYKITRIVVLLGILAYLGYGFYTTYV